MRSSSRCRRTRYRTVRPTSFEQSYRRIFPLCTSRCSRLRQRCCRRRIARRLPSCRHHRARTDNPCRCRRNCSSSPVRRTPHLHQRLCCRTSCATSWNCYATTARKKRNCRRADTRCMGSPRGSRNAYALPYRHPDRRKTYHRHLPGPSRCSPCMHRRGTPAASCCSTNCGTRTCGRRNCGKKRTRTCGNRPSYPWCRSFHPYRWCRRCRWYHLCCRCHPGYPHYHQGYPHYPRDYRQFGRPHPWGASEVESSGSGYCRFFYHAGCDEWVNNTSVRHHSTTCTDLGQRRTRDTNGKPLWRHICL